MLVDPCGHKITWMTKKENGLLIAILNMFMILKKSLNPIRTLFIICLWSLMNKRPAYLEKICVSCDWRTRAQCPCDC